MRPPSSTLPLWAATVWSRTNCFETKTLLPSSGVRQRSPAARINLNTRFLGRGGIKFAIRPEHQIIFMVNGPVSLLIVFIDDKDPGFFYLVFYTKGLEVLWGFGTSMKQAVNNNQFD